MSDYALTLSDAEVRRYLFMAEQAQRMEAAQWTLAGFTEGAAVADVGCGPGAMSTLIAGLVGPNGRVAAVDQNAEAVATATALAAKLEHGNVDCRVGDATDTGLEPGSFDIVMMRHVLAHNGGREQAIVDHLATLLKPGGCLYLVDIDGTAMRNRPLGLGIDDMSARYWDFQTARGNDISVGLRLGELVKGAGLELVEHRGWYDIIQPPGGFRPPAWAARDLMVEAGFADATGLERWNAAFERLDAAPGLITIFVSMFSAIGRK